MEQAEIIDTFWTYQPPFEELKRCAYCKYHTSFSHATNDCNVFRRHIQSTINEGRLSFSEMQVDKLPFPMNTIDLEGKKVLIRPDIAELANKNNMVIGESRKENEDNRNSGRQVVLDKQPDGKEVIKITIKNPTLGGQPQVQEDAHDKFVKPKNSEVGKGKRNEARRKRIKPTFYMLLSKYANQVASSSSNRPSTSKRSRSHPQESRCYGRPCGSSPPLYAPYYMGGFNGGWGQPSMGPYAFYMGWAAPNRLTRGGFSYSPKGHFNQGDNRPSQGFPSKVNKKVWRAKSHGAEISESNKRKEIQGPIVDNLANPNDDTVGAQQDYMANDHEASTNTAKYKDPKYA